MLPLFIFSNGIVLLILAFMLLKFGCMGNKNYQCSNTRHKYTRNKSESTPKDKPPFDEKDIVPDGQSGF